MPYLFNDVLHVCTHFGRVGVTQDDISPATESNPCIGDILDETNDRLPAPASLDVVLDTLRLARDQLRALDRERPAELQPLTPSTPDQAWRLLDLYARGVREVLQHFRELEPQWAELRTKYEL
jgi:hypothetical protein